MYSRRLVYYIGCGLLLLCCSPLALAQNIQHPFITDDANANYPLYCVLDSVLGRTTNDRNISVSNYFSLNYYGLDSFIANTSSNQTVSVDFFIRKTLDYLLESNAISGYIPANEYDSTVQSTLYLIELPRNIKILSSGLTLESNSGLSYCATMKLGGTMIVRTVNSDSTVNINSNRPTLADNPQFDVFFYARLVPTYFDSSGNSPVTFGGTLVLNSSGSTPRLYFSAYNRTRIDYDFTFQLCACFRVDSQGNFIDFDKLRFGLPWSYDGGSTIYFCRGSSGYWSFGSASTYPSFIEPFASTAGLYKPFYETTYVQSVSTTWAFGGVSGDPAITSHMFLDLDTDGGGMTDNHEWYQTKHNLLNASDDRGNTQEIEPVETPLEEPPEGESVVDVGKDTVDRYKDYWDTGVGDTYDLSNITPERIPDVDSFAFGGYDVESISRRTKSTVDSALEGSSVGSDFDSAFSAFSGNDQPMPLTFSPSLNFSAVNTTMNLGTVDLNPAHILGFNTRSNTYASAFRAFRYALFVVEVLVFGYSCFKLVFNTLSPSGDSESGEE